MDFSKIINLNAVDIGYHARDKADVLEHMSNMLYASGAITSTEDFMADVYLREGEGMTGIGDGIAIPHGKSSCVKRSCVAICSLSNSIQWESIDDTPVKLVFLFAVVKEAAEAVHLKMMANIASALADEKNCALLKEVQTPQEFVALFDSFL